MFFFLSDFYPYDLLYDPCSDNPSSFFSICDDPFLSSFGDYEEPNGIGFRFPDWGDGRERRSCCVNWIWASDEALTVVDSGV